MAYMCMRICWRKSARGNSEMRQPTSFPQKMAHYFECVTSIVFSERFFINCEHLLIFEFYEKRALISMHFFVVFPQTGEF